MQQTAPFLLSTMAAALLAAACSKPETASPSPPSPPVAALDGFFQAEGKASVTWTGYLTGSIEPPVLPEGFEPLARGYFSVRFDLPLSGEGSLPLSGVFVPDDGALPRAGGPPSEGFPRAFDDDRLQLRAELARRLSVAPGTVSTFARDYVAAIPGADAASIPLLHPPSSGCSRALDPQVACESDKELAAPFGLQVTFDVWRMRSYDREISAPIAADLVLGQHPGEQRWTLPVTLPAPGGGAAEKHTWNPVVLARVHATVSAISAEGLDQRADVFGGLDTWGWVALMRIMPPPALTAEDQQRIADNEAALALDNAEVVVEGGFSVETLELAMARFTGCF